MGIDWEQFDSEFSQSPHSISLFKNILKTFDESLASDFYQDRPVEELVVERSNFLDQLLIRLWQQFVKVQDASSLVAVGGYGRGELHPGSDIDLLIIIPTLEDCITEPLQGFLTFLWDIGLEVGHSVRTISDCIEQAINDITIVTNLMEARLITGNAELFKQMLVETGPDKIWPSGQFFQSKLTEQQNRHRRFGDTAYNLEPNIKENPGGLRDIQVIGWVVKRHFQVSTIKELIRHNFITEQEYQTLNESQNFLWRIRFGLHLLAGRRDDRLQFDYQRQLATLFAYKDEAHKLAVELFMKDYYRVVMELNRLNEMLLQLFDEIILHRGERLVPTPINNRFHAFNGYIAARDENIFVRHPVALLEIFLLLQQRPELKGVRAKTIRLIRQSRNIIDERFRSDPRCQNLFMEIFKQPHGLTHELRRMNRYGVLARYIPVFGNIVGQMQHDMFHCYTVDEHTMFLVRNLRRLTVPEFRHELPLCSNIITR
ncbi:MAG: bifunctional uridylyltransferase/uridylyl-removing protein GlnD, partial [Thiohalomonadales bacterium]